MKLSRKLWFFAKTAQVYVKYKLKQYIPFVVIIAPTLKCNLKCKYCSIWKWKFIESIKLESLYSLVNEISQIGIPFITFSGGEPLLLKNIENVAEYAHKKNIITNLNTNGTLLNKKRAEKIARSFDYIRVSLNGFEQTHDEMCGVKGSYKRVIRAIHSLTSIPNREAKIGINYILTKNNVSQLESFHNYFKNKVDFISFFPEFSFQHLYKADFSYIQSGMSKKQINTLGTSKNFIKNPDLSYGKKFCDAGKLVIFITSNGDVYACPFIPQPHKSFILGSIFNDKLINILKKKKEYNFSKYCEGCCAICTTEISRIFRMNPIKLISNFYQLNKIYKV